jgi:hypothetical protein
MIDHRNILIGFDPTDELLGQLLSQTEDPETPFKEADRANLLKLIHSLKVYEDQQVLEFFNKNR